MDYIQSIRVSGGDYAIQPNASVTFVHPKPLFCTNALRMVGIEEDLPGLHGCEYIQLCFELPIQIQQVHIRGGHAQEVMTIYSHETPKVCICEPVQLAPSTTLVMDSHTASDSFCFFVAGSATNPIHINIQLDIHQSTANQLLLAKFVTSTTTNTFNRITKENNQANLALFEKLTTEAKNQTESALRALSSEIQEAHTKLLAALAYPKPVVANTSRLLYVVLAVVLLAFLMTNLVRMIR